jgi:hypothetical protein
LLKSLDARCRASFSVDKSSKSSSIVVDDPARQGNGGKAMVGKAGEISGETGYSSSRAIRGFVSNLIWWVQFSLHTTVSSSMKSCVPPDCHIELCYVTGQAGQALQSPLNRIDSNPSGVRFRPFTGNVEGLFNCVTSPPARLFPLTVSPLRHRKAGFPSPKMPSERPRRRPGGNIKQGAQETEEEFRDWIERTFRGVESAISNQHSIDVTCIGFLTTLHVR